MITWKVQPKTHTFHSAKTGDGDGEVFNLNGEYTELIITAKGANSWDGTVTFRASQDGTNFSDIIGSRIDTAALATTYTGTTVYLFQFNVSGITKFKCPVSGATTGNVTVTGSAVVGSN